MKREFKVAILFLLLLVGCTKEKELGVNPSKGDAILNLTIPQTRAQLPYDESSIVSARLIVFHSNISTGAKKMVLNTTDFVEVGNKMMQCREIVPSGYINVYLITNEASTGIGEALDAITASSTEADLENIKLDYEANPVAPAITMFRAYKGLSIVSNGMQDGKIFNADGTPIDTSDWGSVERNAVKLNLKLICDYKTLPWNGAGTPIIFQSVTVKSLPKKPYLTSRQYSFSDDGDYFDGVIHNITAGEQVNNGQSVETKDDALTFLVPEHLVGDKSRYTWVEIKCSLGSATLTYKMALGQGLGIVSNAEMMSGDALLSDLNLLRNTEYKIKATIKEIGEVDGMEIFQSVEPWAYINVPADPLERQFNVSSTTATVSSLSRVRIYFWSNQPSVSVDAVGINGGWGATPTWGSNTYNVSTVFEGLGNGEANISYDAVTGAGYIDIMPPLGYTASSNTYYRSIFLNAGGLKREIRVTFHHVQHPLAYNYIGTFHRKSQTGERVIYMPNTGAWSATADANWVLLSTSRSRDNMLGTTFTPGDAEDYQVTDGQTTVSGTGNIYLRVGLKSTTASNRYTKITITGSSDSRNPRIIYVRQGEDADYVMRPQDAYGNDPGMGRDGYWRPAAMKFLPYNLTSPTEPTATGTQVDVNGGVSVQYPTQAGAHWQWTGAVPRMAIHPVNGTRPGHYVSGLWSVMGADHETCPPGFRRPKDGVTDANVENYTDFPGNVGNSETRQSLLLSPNTAYVSKTDEELGGNSAWGYYADGFFDRRNIGSIDLANTAVSTGDANVAYVGKVYYNPDTFASLFFPAAGESENSYGIGTDNAGRNGNYWTCTPNRSTEYGNRLRVINGSTWMLNLYRSYRASIRCVKYEAPESFPAYPGVIAYDPVRGDLNLEGRGLMVYFKFGSVVAMYAGQTNNIFDAARDIAFNPMTNTSAITGYGNDSNVLPDVPGYVTADWDANLKNISDPDYHHAANIALGKGDPCKLVGYTAAQVRSGSMDNGEWRMPTNAEHTGFAFGVEGNSWDTKASPNDPTPRKGHTFPLIAETYYGKFLPAAGYRDYTSGTVSLQSSTGYFWSSTPYSNVGGYSLHFTVNSVSPYGYYQSHGFPVRCIRSTVTGN